MYICICNAISDREIIEAQQNGYKTIEQISQHLGVGDCCGRCIESAKDVLRENSGVQHYMPQNLATSALNIA